MKPPLASLADAPAVQMMLPQSVASGFKSKLNESQFYFIHLLTTKALRSGKPIHLFHPLKVRFLELQLGVKPRERQIQKLIDLGLVLVRTNEDGKETYEAGVRPKEYRLNEYFIDEIKEGKLAVVYSKANRPLSKRLYALRRIQREKAIVDQPLLQREYDWLTRFQFDKEQAYAFQDQFELTGRRGSKKYNRESAIRLEYDTQILSQLSTGDFTFNYNGTRLTTAVCNAMREMRQCLRDSAGNSFIELDLKSSQLVFLCKALVHYHKEGTQSNIVRKLLEFTSESVDLSNLDGVVPSDTKAFINHVLHGDIYRELQINEQEYNDNSIAHSDGTLSKGFSIKATKNYDSSRADFKKVVMKEFLFNYYTRKQNFPKLSKVMSETYPSVEHFLKLVAQESRNPKKSRDIANLTQHYEAYFFHQTALDALTTRFPNREFYIVHDGIGVPEDILSESKSMLGELLQESFSVKADLFK